MTTAIDDLIQYIRDETGYAGAIDADDDLLEKGILDSFNIVSLAMFAQERFGVEFEGDDLVRDNLARLSTLVALIDRRRAERS
jgi:acyl carrier protein